MSFRSGRNEFVHIFYREVRDKNDLSHDIIESEEDLGHIQELLSDVHKNVQYTHLLDNLDVNTYFIDWVEIILSGVEPTQIEISPELKNTLTYLAEDFADNMKSRAREQGKYVVFIVSVEFLIVCHSFTGKKALTTEMEVIEELLSEANIDKYARFTRGNNNIEVQHFDRHDTESFSDWLGIPEDEIVFDVKGSVRIFTEIDGIDAVFEFDQHDISTKLLSSDDYELSNGMLKTPNEPARSVKRVRWGHQSFMDTDEFKQKLIKTDYNLTRAFDLYDQEISDSLDSFFDVTDNKDRIVKENRNEPKIIRKPNVNFELVFVNSQVKMHEAWKKELCQKLLTKQEPIVLCHAGSDFSEKPFSIGNFRIYNDISLNRAQQRYISDLMKTANDLGTSNLTPLFCHIIFELLYFVSPKPLKYLFQEFADEFESEFFSQIQDGTRIIQTEGEEIDFEHKSPPWFDRQSDVNEIAEGIHREFQTSRLLMLGINEGAREIDVIESGVSSEDLDKVEKLLIEEYSVAEPHIWPIKIDGGHGIIALNVKTPSGPFEHSIALLEPNNGDVA